MIAYKMRFETSKEQSGNQFYKTTVEKIFTVLHGTNAEFRNTSQWFMHCWVFFHSFLIFPV